jgi:hypothetical protein
MRQNSSSSILFLFIILFALTTQSTPLRAASQAKPSSQEVGLQVQLPAEGHYQIGRWLPVTVTISNQGVDFIGDLRLQTGRLGAEYTTQVDLPRNSQKTVTIYAYIDRLSRRITIKLFNAGESLLEQSVRIQPHATNDLLIGLLSADQAQTFPVPEGRVDGKGLVVVPIGLDDLPVYHAGLSSFRSLLIDGANLEVLSPSQHDALQAWIKLGGQLIINGNSRASDVLAGLPEALRPAQVTGQTQMPGYELLPSLNTDGVINLLELQALAESRAQGNSALSGGPEDLLYQRSLGRGNVVLSRIDLSDPLLATWPLWGEFWHEMLPHQTNLTPGIMPNNTSVDQFLEGNIASNLPRLSALELPSLTLLGLLLLIYCLLVGPATFLVLRKLDRQALGWVIVPIITLIFAGIAYGVSYSRRGGDAIVNEITLIEPIDDANARMRTFVGVFSPSNHSFEIAVGEQGLVRPISTLGVWDTSELDGVYADSKVRELALKQWSMRSVMAESLQSFSSLEASIRLDGLQYHAEVTNRSPYRIRDVAFVHDVYVAEVGDLEPGEQKQISFGSKTAAERKALRDKFQGNSLGYLFYHKLYEADDFGISGNLPPEIQIRQGLLDALWSDGFTEQRRKPLLVCWLADQPIQISLNADKVERQQTVMLVQEVPFSYGGESIVLDQAWLSYTTLQARNDGNNVLCYLGQGPGVSQTSEDLVHQLQLPADFIPAKIETITLVVAADGNLPKDIRLQAYDWTAHEWIDFDYARRVNLDQPERFVDPSIGKLRVRVLGSQDLQTYTCVSVNAEILINQ